MKRKTDPSSVKQAKRTAAASTEDRKAAWERADERLDDALRRGLIPCDRMPSRGEHPRFAVAAEHALQTISCE